MFDSNLSMPSVISASLIDYNSLTHLTPFHQSVAFHIESNDWILCRMQHWDEKS